MVSDPVYTHDIHCVGIESRSGGDGHDSISGFYGVEVARDLRGVFEYLGHIRLLGALQGVYAPAERELVIRLLGRRDGDYRAGGTEAAHELCGPTAAGGDYDRVAVEIVRRFDRRRRHRVRDRFQIEVAEHIEPLAVVYRTFGILRDR